MKNQFNPCVLTDHLVVQFFYFSKSGRAKPSSKLSIKIFKKKNFWRKDLLNATCFASLCYFLAKFKWTFYSHHQKRRVKKTGCLLLRITST